MDQLGRRQVTAEEGAQWAADRDMLFLGQHLMTRANHCNVAFLETSAKKHDGVDTVFTVLVDQILQRPQVNLDFCNSECFDYLLPFSSGSARPSPGMRGASLVWC